MKKWSTNASHRDYIRHFKTYTYKADRRRKTAYSKHILKVGLSGYNKRSIGAVKHKTASFFKLMAREHTSNINGNSFGLIELPKDFCFIHHPSNALEHIYRAHMMSLNPNIKQIHIDHSRVTRYNLTSEVLLGLGIEISKTIRWLRKTKQSRHWKQKHRKLSVSATPPKDKDHQQLIIETGLVKEMRTKSEPLITKTGKQHLFRKQSVGTSIANAYSNDDKSKTAIQFCNYVNKCVEDHNLILTDEAANQLLITISEVLDNAERHSSKTKGSHIWHARGYLNSDSNSEHLEISLFNFGMTIAETFSALPDSFYGKDLVMQYVNAHASTDFTTEQLTTVAALQHRYSSRNLSQTDTNGQGTIDLIEFFEQFCTNLSDFPNYGVVKPEMSIVSGQTHILFDGTYRLTKLPNYTEDESEQFVIAFNNEDSLKSPPDSRYVKRMGEGIYFPGVAISIKVPLKEEDNNGE